MRTGAVTLVLCAWLAHSRPATGQHGWAVTTNRSTPPGEAVQRTVWAPDPGYSVPSRAQPIAADFGGWQGEPGARSQGDLVQPTPVGQEWISAPANAGHAVDGGYFEPGWGGQQVVDAFPTRGYAWQVLPDSLIYRSYQAGVREPRLSIVAFREGDGRSLWDGTLGARVGLLRYGTYDGLYPQGWQLDVEAAAIVRLTLDEIRDFETADYRVGVPLTYGVANWQFKFAMYHLSSHLGDEFAIANPGSLDGRINYVRDALVVGASYYPHPALRLYSEAAYAVNVDGGAEPWEFQLGSELSRPGPTGLDGTPFVAVNAHLREEHNFGGDFTAQAGWLWRDEDGQVVRAGVHYFNGKSSQYQTFDDSEQQIGFGLWYDF